MTEDITAPESAQWNESPPVEELEQRIQRLEGLTSERRVRWMLEELRVSMFAQALGTREKVSEERVLRAIRGGKA